MRIAPVVLISQLVWGAALGTPQTLTDPCAHVIHLANTTSFAATNGIKVVDGQAAQNCLLSMPFNATRANDFLIELRKYIEFQSTLEVLKNPPNTYLSPSADILGGIDKIAGAQYTSQYQFDNDLVSLIKSANDGHFNIWPCSYTGFSFFRAGDGLISVSKDGLGVPEIYTAGDGAALRSNNSTVSPVMKINGQDAMEYLENIAASSSQQDPDARWNSLFTSLWKLAAAPNNRLVYLGQFTYNAGGWPGTNNTQLEFKNGSTIDLPTYATYDFGDYSISSSEEFYTKLCIPAASNGNSRRDTPTIVKKDVASTYTAGPLGYPTPFVRDGYNNILGFNLDDEVAVMYMPTMQQDDAPEDMDLIVAQTATRIVNTALSEGRTKLIIDLSGNQGGSIRRAFDYFKLFFPSEFPYSNTRMRRHDSMEVMVQGLRTENATTGGIAPFYWQAMVDPLQEKGFTSVEEFLEGQIQLGVNVTSAFANFNYTLLSSLDRETGPIRGFAGVPLNTTQPYKSEDILIITDGVCASTCTTFVNLMTNVGNVRAVTFGGRHRVEPIQAMGGVRGAQSATFSLIDTYVQAVVQNVNDKKLFTKAEETFAESVLPLGIKNMPLFLSSGNVNLRNAYQEGTEELPLQFEYQAADCRLFYTPEGLQDPSKNWANAKNAMWGNSSCVSNSTGGKGSLEYRLKGSDSGNSTGSGGKTSTSGGNRKHDVAASLQLAGGVFVFYMFMNVFFSIA